MTTPAVDTATWETTVGRYTVTNRFTGQIMAQGENVGTRVALRRGRPASVNVPKRADNTRGNAPWVSWGSYLREGDSSFSDYSGTEAFILTRGRLLFWGHNDPPSMTQADRLLSNARLAALSKGTAAAAQLSAALRQAKDVYKMADHYVSRATTGLNALSTKNYKGLARYNFEQLPSDYLAYLYGMRPLADDVENGLNELSKMNDYGMAMSMVLRSRQQVRETITAYNGVKHGTGLRDCKYSGSRTSVARVGYRFDLPSWFMDNVPVVAPFSSQYQLARYSFVLDWFLPVGDWIGALESAQFSPYFKEGFETRMVRDDYDLSTAECTNGINPRIDIKGDAKSFYMIRSAISEFPSTIMQRPALNPFPGVDKISQGISLLTQLLQRMR